MKYNNLGNTNISVSEIAFGTLTMGALQKNKSEQEVTPIVQYAIDQGINLFDCAELYDSYHVLRQAVKHKHDVIISSKSYAYDKVGAEKAVTTLLREINRDYVDIFMLHETESEHTIRGHMEAVNYYIQMQQKGYIRYLGISTHNIKAVISAIKFPFIQVIHPIINYKGLGIADGTRDEMLQAIKNAHDSGIGIYAMKAFGGGHLLKDRQTAIDFIKNCEYIDSTAIGIQSISEIDSNIELFKCNGNKSIIENASINNKRVIIQDWCQLCGKCVARCTLNALKIVDNKVTVNYDKCVLCGYCGGDCSEMAIKIV